MTDNDKKCLFGWKRYLTLVIGTICMIIGVLTAYETAYSLYRIDDKNISHEEYIDQMAVELLLEVIDSPIPMLGGENSTLFSGLIGVALGIAGLLSGKRTGNKFLTFLGVAVIVSCLVSVFLSFTFASFFFKLVSGTIKDI